jgi:exopolysaccharide production protein ExoZ
VKTIPPSRTSRVRYNSVQALRFVAAVLVVTVHSTYYTHERLDPSIQTWTFGTIGVDIFFVISGFVMIVATRGTDMLSPVRRATDFFMRRLIRIAPMYWLATSVNLAVLLAAASLVLHSTLDWPSIGLSYLFLPSRNEDGIVEPLLGVGWTLIFEMFFYVIFALALLRPRHRVLLVGATLSFFAFGFLLRPAEDWNPFLVYFDPIVLYFLAGMAIGHYTEDGRRARLAVGVAYPFMAISAIALISPNQSRQSHGMSDAGAILRAAIAIGLVLVAVLCARMLQDRIPLWLLFLGDASYSLYLFHPLIAPAVPTVLDKVGLDNGVLSVVGGIVVACVTTSVIYRWAERPTTRYLTARFKARRASARTSGDLAVSAAGTERQP